ncbi:MAG: hypothetical protein Kow0099_02350 [Candidatus Abyssubacteria bacterium]
MNFGYILRTLRISAGVSLREFSKMIGVSPTYLSFVETGKQSPPCAARIARIEEALNVPPGYLMALANRGEHGFEPFSPRMPEVFDFLAVADRCSMCSSDFMELTEYLNRYGWQNMKHALENGGLRSLKVEPSRNEIVGPYLWPFLKEKLIFDMIGIESKEAFLQRAVELLAKESEGVLAESLLKALHAREATASTGIGRGVAVPHAYVSVMKNTVIALYRVLDGMNFDSIDGQPVHLVLLMAGPRSSEDVHLKLLARMARLLRYDSFIEGIMTASGPAEIVSLFRSAEMRIP